MKVLARRARHSTVAATLIGVFILGFGTWYGVSRGISVALEQNAKITAGEWAGYLSQALPGLEELLEGEPAGPETRSFIESARTVGNVFRYKLWDPAGGLRLDSANLGAGTQGAAPLSEHNPEAAEVFRTGVPFLESEEGDGVERPLHYAEAYYPLSLAGQRIGVLEVYVDQTERTQQTRQEFYATGMFIAGFAALGFLVPMLAFIRRSGQKAAADAALRYAARHDALTGLLNRAEFRDVIERRIEAQPDRAFRVEFLDLDKFKYVNDSKGHAVGDELLRQVAGRLLGVAGPAAHACRLGGDEFAIIEDVESTPQPASHLARALVEALSAPYTIRGDEVTIGVSIGIATYPRDAMTSSELLKAADLALYEVKTGGRGHFSEYAPEMEVRRDRRIAVEHRLRQAAERLDFRIDYQPLYRRESGTLAGFEALMRMSDAEGKPLSPAEFIPIAEETELIIPLGKAMLARACCEAVTWPGELSVAVNLSTVQFSDGTLPEAVRRALDESGLAPQRLELEVTETVLMSDPDAVSMQLDSVKEMGVSVALDDFGTGYSSLSYLWRFPFDKLKIDGSFMASLEEGDERSMQVLRTIVALGEVLKLEVTAEGVETRGQAQEIGRLNVDFVQGYLYGRPVPASALPDVISGRATADLGSQPEACRPEPVHR